MASCFRERISLPEDISLCSRTADSTESAEISYEIQNNWGDGFIAAVTVKNTSEKPLEAWKLSFNGNFDISTIWNANLLYTDDCSFKFENDITTTPIPVGGEKVFSFQGIIASGETPAISDFKLISIVIYTERIQPEPPVETEEAPSHETSEPSTGDEPDPATEETNETEEPVDPDPDENTILCFGEYLSEEKSIKVYWYSTAEGTVSVHENTDGNGWRKLAEVTDGDSYEFTITEDFAIKYIRVSQQTADGMIESEPFIVAANEDGYACTWLDSDNDGLPDYAEKIYGTDPENADTDGDGLSDYDEIYKTGTNPLKYDTDEDGVNDADSDNDKDGLTNSEELALGTDPNSADTDGDSLSDYDEINKHNTDPLKADSDGDTLNDGDEIILGLDPNDPETFGVPDAEYKVKQTISADSEVMERVNTEDSPYELSLEITASGNAQNLIAGSSAYSAITESDARLGGAVSLDYYGGDVEKVKLTYEIGESYISNEGSEYAKNCVDLQGIKRYNIFRYFEELNILLPVATEFDEENNTLFAETDELGTYCVLDMEVLLQTFGVNPDGSQTEQVETQMYSAPTDSDEYCVTFVFDIRKGRINAGQLENLKAEVCEFAETVFAEGRNVSIRIMTQDSSDFDGDSSDFINECGDMVSLNKAMSQVKVSKYEGDLGNYCVITDAIAETVNSVDTSVNNYVFTLFDQTNSLFEQNIAEELGNKAKKNGINISVITPSFEELVGFQKTICNVTGGIMIDTFSDFANDVYEHIFDETYEPKDLPPEPQKEFDAILITGYERITLDSILYPNGENPTGKDSDTDKDGLTDWDEVDVERWEKSGLISRENNGYINLPTLQQCMDYSDKSYVEEGLGRFISQPTISLMLNDIRVMPITSDPTREDSDGDGITDGYDPHKLIKGDKDTPCLYEINPLELNGVDKHAMLIDMYDGCQTYICANCGFKVVAPELEDQDNLSEEDFILVQMLLAIYNHFVRVEDVCSREIVYASIDKIRTYKQNNKYSFSDEQGNYISPISHTSINDDNDYFVDILLSDTTIQNKKMKLYTDLLVYGFKTAIDITTLSLSPTWYGIGLGVVWSVLSEYALTLYENRDLNQYNAPSVMISSTLTFIDGVIDTDGLLSSINLAYSLYNQIGISQQKIVNDKSYIYRDYNANIIIKCGMNEMWFSVNLKQIDISDLSNTRYSSFGYKYFRDETTGLIKHKNAMLIQQSDYNGRDYERTFGIVGCYYYVRDITDDNFKWVDYDERKGGVL